MLWMVFWFTVPFDNVACADKAAPTPATRAKAATRLCRFIPSPPDRRERLPQRGVPNGSRPTVSDVAVPPGVIAAWTGDARWRRAVVGVRGSCPFGPTADVSRCGHHDVAVRGSDLVASLTVFEKARERNDVGR